MTCVCSIRPLDSWQCVAPPHLGAKLMPQLLDVNCRHSSLDIQATIQVPATEHLSAESPPNTSPAILRFALVRCSLRSSSYSSIVRLRFWFPLYVVTLDRFPALLRAFRTGMADPKSSFLGSISPWSISRSSTPPPKTKAIEQSEDGLKPTAGLDHIISLRPSPSISRYPKDCPPLKTR